MLGVSRDTLRVGGLFIKFHNASFGISAQYAKSGSCLQRNGIGRHCDVRFMRYVNCEIAGCPVRIALTHMVPYVLPQYLVGIVLLFPHAIMAEASVTFLGFGLPPDIPAIGTVLSESMSYLSAGMWWLAFFPGVALVLTVMLFDLVGSGLRRVVDPHSSQE